MTVTGCLQQNAMSGAGAYGSNQSRSGNFMLTNAKMAQGSSTSALGTAAHFSLTGMSNADLDRRLARPVAAAARCTRVRA